MRQYESGLNGERQAEHYLTQQGMTIKTRRYRSQDGEIDLIMEDGATIVFVEVKARPTGKKGSGLLSITPDKQRRITHAATAFLVEKQWVEKPVRFDVVEISKEGLLHIPNAFMAVY